MLKDLLEKVSIIQEQMGNVSREIKIPRQVLEEMLEIKNTVAEMNSDFDGLINRLSMAKKRLHEMCRKSWTEMQREKKKIKAEHRELWDILKKYYTHTHTHTHTQKSLPISNTKKRTWSNYSKNFPKLMTDNKPQFQEAQRIPSRRNSHPHSLAYHIWIVVNQRHSWKETRGENITYKGMIIKIMVNFSSETMQVRREWSEILCLRGTKSST